MKILQLNVWSFRLIDEILTLINREKPDIICFQEATSISGEGLDYAGIFGLVQEIQNKSEDLEHLFHAPTIEFRFTDRFVSYGNAILSRWPITSKETVFTSDTGFVSDFSFTKHSSNIRNFQDATIETPEGALHVINHHGHWVPEHKNGNDETLRQMTKLARHIDGIEAPVVVCGDFNLAPESESIGLLNDRLTNLSIKHALTTTRNQLTTKNEVCDYIFVNDRVTVQKFQKLDDLASDHAALIAEISLS